MNKERWQPISTAPRDGRTIRARRVLDGEVTYEGTAYFGNLTVDYGEDAVALKMEPIYIHRGVWIRSDSPHLFPTPTEWLPE